jgi:hypothetical protein
VLRTDFRIRSSGEDHEKWRFHDRTDHLIPTPNISRVGDAQRRKALGRQLDSAYPDQAGFVLIAKNRQPRQECQRRDLAQYQGIITKESFEEAGDNFEKMSIRATSDGWFSEPDRDAMVEASAWMKRK